MSRVDRFALNRADVIWARKSQTSLRGYTEPAREVSAVSAFSTCGTTGLQQRKEQEQTLTKQSKGEWGRATAVTTGEKEERRVGGALPKFQYRQLLTTTNPTHTELPQLSQSMNF